MEGVMTELPITSAEENAQRRLEVKARSTLMIGIPNEHQLKFNSIKDAKKLLEAVKKRFSGNAATRKTQRNLLKQQYENFTSPSSEMLDQTFDRLQKLRNKVDLDTMSMDDLYNNLKVYEPKVKGMSSLSSSTQNMAFVSSSNNNTSSTNEAVNTAHGVSTTSTQVNAAKSTNIDNLSDAVICAFFASQPNSPQLVHEDLQQIHPDDMEDMNLRCPKWSATTATIGDILPGSAELQEIKTTRTRKAFRVFNRRTRIVEENLHIRFSENTPNVIGSGPDWLFDIDALTRTMNYKPIVAGTHSNGFADSKSSHDDGSKPSSDNGKKVDEDPRKDSKCNDQEKEDDVNAASTNEVNVVGAKTSIKIPFDPNMPALEDISIFDFSRGDEDDDAETDMNILDTTIQLSPNLTTRIHKDHPLYQVIG
ncbi:hypothetical protein Tco_1307116, partial [Tanacetum coccineum]